MNSSVKIIPLGGLGEIGLNMTAFECDDSIVVVDCGLMFPDDRMPGIDIVIPDVSYLIENKDRVKAFVITHGHEDHIGALPFVLKKVNAPIYSTRFTRGLIEYKLGEHGILNHTTFETVKPRDKVTIGPFEFEFIRVSHSIVDGVALAIQTPAGVIIHTGDFKFDQTPIDGEVMDYARFAEYGDRGVKLLMSDSTNVDREGFTVSEQKISATFKEIFSNCEGRIIIAAFSSNIHRMQQVFNVAKLTGRRVILNGKSMVNNAKIARTLGYLDVPEGVLVEMKDIENYAPAKIVLLTTGSQGEPMSALTRMAIDNHKQVKIKKGDTVILSSRFIPGHEKAISNMMNHLSRRGAEIIYDKIAPVHVSGHATREELKIMLNLVKPEHFIPIHGEYRHLSRHAKLAQDTGVKEENIVIAEDGDVVELTAKGLELIDKVEAGKVFVDGKGVGDVGEMVLKDRRHLSQDGMVLAVVAIHEKTGEIIYGPDIVTRGVVFEQESEELIDRARDRVIETLESIGAAAKGDSLEVEEEVRRALRRFFNKALERRPVILPMIIEI